MIRPRDWDCQTDSKKHISMKHYLKFKCFHSRKNCFKMSSAKCRLPSFGLSVLAIKIGPMGIQWKGVHCRRYTAQYDTITRVKIILLSANRVLHTLDVVADNCLTGHFRLARPHWNNMARLSCHAKYPNPLQMYGWVICFEINCTWKQMSHRVMFAYRCWSEI